MDQPEVTDRDIIQKILLTCCHQLKKSDDGDWIEFMIDEVLDNADDITTAMALHNQIGDHLMSVGLSQSQELSAMEICTQIYTALWKAEIIPKPSGAESLDQLTEPEGEEEQSEDSNEGYKELGGCVICHREMPLTKHHLIPREVHPWYKKREGKTHKELHTGIMVCRDCHSAIHKFISNKDMGAEYNTLEKLLSHEKVQSWVPYISKQRCTNKADKRTWVQHVPKMPSDFSDDD